MALADSLAAAQAEEEVLGGSAISNTPSLLSGQRPEHPFDYSTSYSTLRQRRTWDQTFSFFKSLKGISFANRTTVTIIRDPDVKRQTRNRSTAFEVGYVPFRGLTSGVRAQIARNSDVIGIRLQNSIVRDNDDYLGFMRFDRRVKGLPITAGASFGAVNNQQPEFSSSGRELNMDASTSSRLPFGLSWNVGGSYRKSDLGSEAPSDTGVVKSDDHSTDRQGQGGITWNPKSWFNVGLKGSTRRGILQRPETTFDPLTAEAIVVQEQVTTATDNGDLSLTFRTPIGTLLTASGNVTNNEILYASDSTRTNVTNSKSFQVSAADSLLGAAVSVSFQNGTSEYDYTRRPDGYVQTSWRRAANLTANRRVNRRTNSQLAGSISLDSRRYEDFRPSGPGSFPPSSQDYLRGVGSLRVDYIPTQIFTTGLEGQFDITRTINLAASNSTSNSDQTGYAVTWRWSFAPWDFWTVSQNNSAGAQEASYPFAPDRDQLSFIYQLRTSSVTRLSQKWNLEMHYSLRYQSQGSYRQQESGPRLFGKSGGSDQYDLLLRTTYQIFRSVNLDLSQQTFVTQSFSLPNGEKHVDTDTKRRALYAGLSASYPIKKRGSLSLSVRRSLTRDELQTRSVLMPPPTRHEDDYWQVTSSFRTFFDL